MLESLAVKHADTKYICGQEEHRNTGKERHSGEPHLHCEQNSSAMCELALAVCAKV